MDPLQATWSSHAHLMELDDLSLIHHLQMKPSVIDEPKSYISFSNYPEISSSEAYQSSGIVVGEGAPPALTFCTSPKETLFKLPSSTPPISNPFISCEEKSNSTYPSSPYQSHGLMPRFNVETNAEMSQMICFGSMDDFSSSAISPSSSQELCHLFGTIECGQPNKKGGSGSGSGRTPLQAKYHVIAERKRREKLLQQFIALSAVVPGLKKLNKMSIMDGAMDHIKQLEDRLKAIEDGAKVVKHEGSVVAADEQKLCMGYYYAEESSPTSSEDLNITCSFGQSSKNNIQIKILKREVLIRVTCENRTGLTEQEFVSELNRLNYLSVTKSRFVRFGGNNIMLALSAVAKMKEGFCMAEDEVADRTRLAILKLI